MQKNYALAEIRGGIFLCDFLYKSNFLLIIINFMLKMQ